MFRSRKYQNPYSPVPEYPVGTVIKNVTFSGKTAEGAALLPPLSNNK
jgi:hypothetical protein